MLFFNKYHWANDEIQQQQALTHNNISKLR